MKKNNVIIFAVMAVIFFGFTFIVSLCISYITMIWRYDAKVRTYNLEYAEICIERVKYDLRDEFSIEELESTLEKYGYSRFLQVGINDIGEGIIRTKPIYDGDPIVIYSDLKGDEFLPSTGTFRELHRKVLFKKAKLLAVWVSSLCVLFIIGFIIIIYKVNKKD